MWYAATLETAYGDIGLKSDFSLNESPLSPKWSPYISEVDAWKTRVLEARPRERMLSQMSQIERVLTSKVVVGAEKLWATYDYAAKL